MSELPLLMNQKLVPFGGEGPAAVTLQASAAVQRQGPGQARLQLHYRLAGAEALVLPPMGRPPQRLEGLWQHTCLEAFLAPAGVQTYWEFNLSPCGDWNVYRLEAYRDGLRAEPFYAALPFTVQLHRGTPETSRQCSIPGPILLELSLSCPLPPALAAAPELEMGLSAVVESPTAAISYWALHHPGPEADFHDRRGWTLRL